MPILTPRDRYSYGDSSGDRYPYGGQKDADRYLDKYGADRYGTDRYGWDGNRIEDMNDSNGVRQPQEIDRYVFIF